MSLAAGIEIVEAEPEIVTDKSMTTYPSSASPQTSGSVVYQTAAEPAPASASTELYLQLQSLQAEVQTLRGIVEQQAYLLDQLGQKRMDDYLDLDRRIGELHNLIKPGSAPKKSPAGAVKKTPKQTTKPVVAHKPAASPAPAIVKPAAAPVAPVAAQADEAREAYRTAYEHVKQRRFDDAKVSLHVFINDYPKSEYVPNAYFWLGELYYLDTSLEKSRDAFLAMVVSYPAYRKVPDAKYKLGKIYHQLGDTEKAKDMLNSVLADHPDSKAVNPSREYLKSSLP
jgi:tol-pal system protein YbgF